MEKWKDIKNFSGYQVSNLGRVKSKEKFIKGYGTRIKHQKERILKSVPNHSGYHRLTLRANNKSFNASVHRLVAEAFIMNPFKKTEVNHIDGDKSNNCVSNLEWTTPSENQKHSYKTGLHSQKGSNNAFSKINEDIVREIRQRFKVGGSTCKSLAEDYNISVPSVSMIVNYKTWKHGD